MFLNKKREKSEKSLTLLPISLFRTEAKYQTKKLSARYSKVTKRPSESKKTSLNSIMITMLNYKMP